MVHWLASVSGAGCKFTLKSFVLTAFNQAPRRARTGSLTIARPPALITVSKSGFEPLGWSLGPTQKGLTWGKVNLCHTCVTIWIMEFCNLSEWGGKGLQGKVYAALAALAFMLSSYTRVCISCVNTQGMSELMKSGSIYDSKKERKKEGEQGGLIVVSCTAFFFFRMAKHHSITSTLWEKRILILWTYDLSAE